MEAYHVRRGLLPNLPILRNPVNWAGLEVSPYNSFALGTASQQ